MDSRQLYFDQVDSLMVILKNAGVPRQGEAKLILEGVGRRRTQLDQPLVSFCPSRVLELEVRGGDQTEEMEGDFPSELQMTDSLRDQIIDSGIELGFLRLSLKVSTNGKVLLDGDVVEAEPAEEGTIVYNTDSYDQYQEAHSGQLVGAET